MLRITHPFHPHHGRRFALVTVRQNWGEDRAYYRDGHGELCCIPARWTDAAPPDPVAMVSAGRSSFRLEDLVALTRLVRALEQERTDEH